VIDNGFLKVYQPLCEMAKAN